MANKSGIAEQVTSSLSEGGGALKRIGETFSPLILVRAISVFPFALPSVSGGFQSDLSLVHSTGNGNTCRLGQRLKIPEVSVKLQKLVLAMTGSIQAYLISSLKNIEI